MGLYAVLAFLLLLLLAVLALYRWIGSRGPNPFAVDTRRSPAPLITDKAVRRTVLKAGIRIPEPPPRNAPGPSTSRCHGIPVLPRGSPGAPSLFFPRMPWDCYAHIPPKCPPCLPTLPQQTPRAPLPLLPSPCHPSTDDILGVTPH